MDIDPLDGKVNPSFQRKGWIVSEGIHRGVESGKILADTANAVGGPQGKILELS
jgi:hypothetical protein